MSATTELKLGQRVDPEKLPTLSQKQIDAGWRFEEIHTMEGAVTIIAGPDGWEHK